MISKIKKHISSTEGLAYVPICFLVMFICLLTSIVMLYMGLMAQVQIQKRDVKLKLDNHITQYAVEAFDSIKQGENYIEAINLSKLQQTAYASLGFSASDVSYTYENGNCTMSRPTITVLSGEGVGLSATYIASFPIVWNSKTYADLEVPLTVISYYKFK